MGVQVLPCPPGAWSTTGKSRGARHQFGSPAAAGRRHRGLSSTRHHERWVERADGTAQPLWASRALSHWLVPEMISGLVMVEEGVRGPGFDVIRSLWSDGMPAGLRLHPLGSRRSFLWAFTFPQVAGPPVRFPRTWPKTVSKPLRDRRQSVDHGPRPALRPPTCPVSERFISTVPRTIIGPSA